MKLKPVETDQKHCNREQTSSHRTCLPSTNAVAAAEVQFQVHLRSRNRTISGRHIVTCLRKKEVWYWKWLFDWHIVFHPNLNQKYVWTPKTHLTWSCHPKGGSLYYSWMASSRVYPHKQNHIFLWERADRGSWYHFERLKSCGPYVKRSPTTSKGHPGSDAKKKIRKLWKRRDRCWPPIGLNQRQAFEWVYPTDRAWVSEDEKKPQGPHEP